MKIFLAYEIKEAQKEITRDIYSQKKKAQNKEAQKEVGYPLDMFLLGSKCCKEPGCPQPVYKRELDYCYYHNKVKEGLIDAEIY